MQRATRLFYANDTLRFYLFAESKAPSSRHVAGFLINDPTGRIAISAATSDDSPTLAIDGADDGPSVLLEADSDAAHVSVSGRTRLTDGAVVLRDDSCHFAAGWRRGARVRA